MTENEQPMSFHSCCLWYQMKSFGSELNRHHLSKKNKATETVLPHYSQIRKMNFVLS